MLSFPDEAAPASLPEPGKDQPSLPLPALAVGEREVLARDDNRFVYGLMVAVLAHALTFGAATGAFDDLWPVVPGAPPPPSQSKEDQIERFGDEKGAVDGIAAEVIDADEFDKKYISFKPGRDIADTDPAEQPAQQQQVKATPPPVELETPVDKGPGDDPLPAKREPEKPKKPPDRPESVLSEADIQELLSTSTRQLEGYVASLSKPGEARLGKASPFVRGVLRLLKENMPRQTRVKGKVTVQLIVSATGEVEALRVMRGMTANPELERIIVESILKTRLLVPGKDTKPSERMFQITYDYD